MRLTRLAARDFMAFDDLDLDLTSVASVVVTGENGAGKSSLLDLVTWTLFDRSRVSGEGGGSIDDHIRAGADEVMTRVEFDAGGHSYAVTREKPRGKTGTLNLTVDGEDRSTGHKQDETFARIAGLIGLNFPALVASTFMVQRSEGSFISAKPAAAKDLFVTVAQLERFKPLHAEASRLRKAAEVERDAALSRVAEAERGLDGEAEARDALRAAQDALATAMEAQSLASDRIAAAKATAAAYAGAVKRHSDIEAREAVTAPRLQAIAEAILRAQQSRERAQRYLDTPPPVGGDWVAARATALAEVEALTERASAHRVAVSDQRVNDARVSEFQRDIERALEHEATKASVPCGGVGEFAACRFLTGSAYISIEDGRAQVDALNAVGYEFFPTAEAELEQARDRVAMVERAATSAEYAAREHERLTDAAVESLVETAADLARLADEQMAVQAEMERLAAERADIESEFAAITAAEEDLRQASRAYGNARDLASAAEDATASALRRVAVIDHSKEVVAEWRAKAAATEEHVKTNRVLEAAFHRDGIPTHIIERLIPRVEEEANEVLATLPGGFAVNLRTQRVTGKGTLADTLDIVVLKGGAETPLYMLSYGQRFRVDLALRLAIGRVLAHRAGSTIDTLWLDEPLADLDERGREAVIETLATIGTQFGLVVVVSHHAEFSDRFPARIELEQEDGMTSTARLSA